MYTVSLGAILQHHQIGYHIYADDTQLHASTSLGKLRTAISDVRTWMINNKRKINDNKTEFLVITKPHLVSHLKDLAGFKLYSPLNIWIWNFKQIIIIIIIIIIMLCYRCG